MSEDWTAIARRYRQKANVLHKIELRLAPAVQTLEALLADGQRGAYDFAFIDADKENVQNYYELCLELLRTGGLVAIDNALWSGSVAEPRAQDPETVAIRELNAHIARDPRVSMSLLPIGDGLMLARKR